MHIPTYYRPALLAAAVALLLYAITLKGTYIEDDVAIIREDPRLKQPIQWRHLVSEEYWLDGSADKLYRPLVSLSFALQVRLTGYRAMPLHAANWILNALVCALVAELARRLAGTSPAYLAGLIFAVHPIHVEAVAGLVGRSELMCTAGVLGALILLLHRPMTTMRAIATVTCLAIAVLSKEQGLLLPLLMLLLPLSLGVKRPRNERERQSVLLLVLMVCWLTATYVVLREWKFKFEWDTYFLDFSDQPMVRCTLRDRLLMPLILLGRYAALLVYPRHLSLDYGGLVIGWVVRAKDPYLYIGAVAAIAGVTLTLRLAAIVHRQSKRSSHIRAALFCLLSAGVFYGMIGNVVTLIGTNFGERLMYLPSAFLVIALSIFLTRLPKPLMIAVVAIAVAFGALRSFTYARQWNDRLHFYEDASAQQPKSVRLHMLVADENLKQGKLEEAEAADAAGRQSLPDYWEVWIQSAQMAIARGDFEQANHFLDVAMKLRPSQKVINWKARVAAAKVAAAKATSPKAATTQVSTTTPADAKD